MSSLGARSGYSSHADELSAGEKLAVAVLIGLLAVAGVSWCAGGLASALSGHGLHEVPPRQALALGLELLSRPRSLRSAWPVSVRKDLPDDALLEFSFFVTVLLWIVVVLLLFRVYRALARASATRSGSASWAVPEQLRGLIVARPGQGRLVLGRAGRHLIAAERGHSLLVLGPTQSGKTSGLAIPALLEWEGPLIATSVKTDLLRDTLARRRSIGQVFSR